MPMSSEELDKTLVLMKSQIEKERDDWKRWCLRVEQAAMTMREALDEIAATSGEEKARSIAVNAILKIGGS